MSANINRWKECRHGTLLYNTNDRYIGRSLDLYGEFSEKEVELFAQIVRPGDTVVEVGANIGALTVPLARLVGPRGTILAFEPQRVVFQALCANMALNGITWAFCCHQAVGREPDWVTVPRVDYGRENNFGGMSLAVSRDPREGERVPLTTLDETPMGACRLIKVDAEGMELDVLRGGAGCIGRFRPYLYVENDRAERSEALTRFIDSLGYDLYWHKPPLFNPENFLRNPVNAFGEIISENVLCAPREQGVVMRGFNKIEV